MADQRLIVPEEEEPIWLRPPDDLTRAEQHLVLHLRRFALCLERHALRIRPAADAESVEDERQARDDELRQTLVTLEAFIATAYREPELPLHQLRLRFGLDEPALRLVIAAAAPALDLDLARRLFRFCGRAQPEAGFLVDVLAATRAEERAYVAALRPTAAPLRWGLLRLGESRDWSGETPLLHALAVVPARVIDWLRGETGFDADRFARAAALHLPPPEPPPERDDGLEHALFRDLNGRAAPLVVTGPALAGKAAALIAAARRRGRAVLDVDLEAVAENARPAELLADLGREAMLRDAVLLLRHGEVIADKSPELRRAALGLLGGGVLASAVTLRSEWADPLRRLAGAQQVRVELPGPEEQLAQWRHVLTVPLAPDAELAELVMRYRMAPGDIREAGAAACARALGRGGPPAVTLDDLVTAVRARLRHRLGDVAELMAPTPFSWNDVVLPPEVGERVVELVSTVHHQATVMDTWGFKNKVAYGRAVSALFAGPPGTGKTMVATLIAKELGLELFRIDLSRVVSKWVGETEKNLGRAFDEAKSSQAVLLFDEADALFAKRTDVKSSNDRYANLEVNYLLQRLESFEGIVLLTTNNQSSIDDAFRRRLRFRIEFPIPDQPEREMLWRSMIPRDAPIAGDVAFAELAGRYEMSGGYIKNAVVRAAFLAAAEGSPSITHDLLARAAHREWEEMGRLTRS